ncbi:carboxypeptidase-like regulatory domain-containing protein [Natronomonas salsuginis]|uniref:Carboxypeptidase regulatory-like domain-containing protein n=1 Tax=Natronomonas salsuginis TaxID=2217661 RepID=A0A4U5JF99_9EURY|nr:carboxypeptidase-like regulatory domain-containing protein [Natronomonas salsuginis]TKR28052.1 carboxypeptidase regulatory-like domain-containing protein [Natronomonas salsuginis]
MRSWVVVILVALVLCVGWSASAAANDEVSLTVSVVNQSGAGVGDATVIATWDGGEATGTTASNGKVFIDVPNGADVELDVDDDRYVRNRRLSISDADEREIELPVVPQGTATVTVTDSDGQPLSDATVRLRQDDETVASGETDGNRAFRTDAIERGEYRLSAVKPGFFRNETDLTVGLETEATVALQRGRVTLDIEVVDDHFEPPRTLTEVRVRIGADNFDANVSTSDGTASLNVPANTRYRIVATKDGYESTPNVQTVREASASVIVAAQRIHELTVTTSNDRVIVGETTRIEVTNAYGEPVQGARVRIDGEGVGETDDRGEMTIEIETVDERTIDATDGQVDSEPITVTGFDPDAETGTSEPTPTEAPAETPGFGVVVTVVALAFAFAVRAARQRRRSVE